MPRDMHRDVPIIEDFVVKNYRALSDLRMKSLSPLTVLNGPNGSGKSTILDSFAFLAECFSTGLRSAWDKRGRFKDLRSRNSSGPIEFEIRYREKESEPIITYHLSIDEEDGIRPVVSEEWLQWRRGQRGQPFRFLNFRNGSGDVISGEKPDLQDQRITENLESPEMIAVNTLGQLRKHPRVTMLRRFIIEWYLSAIAPRNMWIVTETGPRERLSDSGDNLPNVIQYLQERYPDRLRQIIQVLSQRVPQLENVTTEIMPDGRLLLQIQDTPFDKPIISRWVSDGTLKMLAYLIIFYDINPPQLIGIEEPENYFHPRLLGGLMEEFRKASEKSQLFITTHSPELVNEIYLEELWIVYREKDGYTRVERAQNIPEMCEMNKEGGKLGSLWMEGYFGVGDPTIKKGGWYKPRLPGL